MDLNRVKSSGLGLLLLGSDLASRVDDLDSDLLGSLDNLCSFLSG